MLFDIDLTFGLPEPTIDPATYLDALYEAGLNDTVIGVGSVGFIGVTFDGEAPSVTRAFEDLVGPMKEKVGEVIPGATLLDVRVFSHQ